MASLKIHKVLHSQIILENQIFSLLHISKLICNTNLKLQEVKNMFMLRKIYLFLILFCINAIYSHTSLICSNTFNPLALDIPLKIYNKYKKDCLADEWQFTISYDLAKELLIQKNHQRFNLSGTPVVNRREYEQLSSDVKKDILFYQSEIDREYRCLLEACKDTEINVEDDQDEDVIEQRVGYFRQFSPIYNNNLKRINRLNNLDKHLDKYMPKSPPYHVSSADFIDFIYLSNINDIFENYLSSNCSKPDKEITNQCESIIKTLKSYTQDLKISVKMMEYLKHHIFGET